MNVDNRYTSLAEEIRQLLVEALIDGRLTPGTRINDIELAQKLGVSRTPVREALRGLKSAGIIETLPARITRVVKLTAEEFTHAKVVWSSLYKLLLSEVIHHESDIHIETMSDMCDRFDEEPADTHATISFHFFDALAAATENEFLRESIRAAAVRLRLGHESGEGEGHTHFRPTVEQARNFLAALQSRDLGAAHSHFGSIAELPLAENDYVTAS